MLEPATENARVAYLNMGNILDDAQRYEEAIEAYQKALSISPKDDAAYYNLGIAYKHAGKPELAITAWKKAAELDPNDRAPWSPSRTTITNAATTTWPRRNTGASWAGGRNPGAPLQDGHHVLQAGQLRLRPERLQQGHRDRPATPTWRARP